MILWFYDQEHSKAQPALFLLLKCLRRWGHGLKSHPTDWEGRESNSDLLGTRRVTYPPHHRGQPGSFLLKSGALGILYCQAYSF